MEGRKHRVNLPHLVCDCRTDRRVPTGLPPWFSRPAVDRNEEVVASNVNGAGRLFSGMLPLQSGPLLSPPGILVTLVLLAVVVLVGRIVLQLAWKLVVFGLLAVTVLWILGILGLEFDVLQAVGV